MPAADDPTAIGNLLIGLGYCSKDDIESALSEMEQRRVGETLVAMNVISAEQLDRALKLQRMKRRQMSPQEEQEFKHGQRSALISELGEMQTNAMAFCEKVNGGGGG